jgi:thymidine kinase
MNLHNLHNLENNNSYLELIIGPMYSGKSSRLVELYKACIFCDIKVSAINHSLDNRYDDVLLSTHDKIKIPCIKTDKLFDILDNPQCINSKIILINEGQFFPDLYDGVCELLRNNKCVYVCGLDGDFERKKFGQILELIPLCDKVTKLTSLCRGCKNVKNPGIFSMRLSNEKEQTIIGSDIYIPVCRTCYEKMKN